MIIAANLKTNLTRKQTRLYVNELETYIKQNNIKQDILVFPATSSLDIHSGKVVLGAQNAYPTQNGAFTGEIGLDQLEEFKDLGFKIIYCVGEPLEKREAGKEEMMKYIASQYEGIDTSYENLIIAYEPVWAIGTGLTPTLEDIELIHTDLKEKSHAPLLYGGSVKVTNAKEVLELKNVDGILVGSAALYSEHFCTMIQFAQDISQ